MKKSFFSKIIALALAVVVGLFTIGCVETPPPENPYGEIKNIILIIGDGMGVEHISAGEIYEGKKYDFTSWKYVSSNTNSIDILGKQMNITTDSAAGGTALATGNLTTNYSVGKDRLGYDLTTIMDYALAQGKKTGVVTTDYLNGATPAAFTAHANDRNDTADIVNTQITSGVNLLCGRVSSSYDGKQSVVESNGYSYCTDYSQIENSKQGDKAFWMFDMAGVSASVSLAQATAHAIEYLDNEKGFVLMVEEAWIDKYSHDNDINGTVKSVKSLNDTVQTVMDWIGDRKDTAVLVTADHETGGLNASATMQNVTTKIDTLNGSKLYYKWNSEDHTNAKVGLFVYGINPDYSTMSFYKSSHLIKNINVFNVMYELLYNGNAYAQ